VLQNLANAGAGQPVAVPTASGAKTAQDVHDQCANDNGWKTAAASAGLTAVTFSTYQPTAGTATVFAPTSTSHQALADQISAAPATVKSCDFDLMGHIQVDLNQLDKASVAIDGTTIPLDNNDGWHMLTPTQLELSGSACATWRSMNAHTIDFKFPCEII